MSDTTATSDERYFEDLRRLSAAELSEADRRRFLGEALGELSEVLSRSPTAFDDLSAVVSRLAALAAVEMWDELARSLVIAVGEKPTNVIAWVADDAVPRLEELEAIGPADAAAFIRRLYVRHAAELDRAWRSWRELPRDWAMMLRTVSWEPIEQRWRIELTTNHRDGTQSVLETTAGGLARLTAYFLQTVRLVGTPEAYGDDARGPLLEEIADLLDFFGLNEAAPAASTALA